MRKSLIAMITLSLGLTAQGEGLQPNGGSHLIADSAVQTETEQSKLHGVFHQYKNATLEDNGEAVANLVSRDSVKHFGYLKRLALDTYLSKELSSARLVDQIQVKILREMIPADQFVSMSDQAILAHVFKQKVLGEDLETSSKLGSVTVSSDSAEALHIARGRPVGQGYREVTFRLVKEQGVWRMDLLHSLDMMEAQIHDLAKVSNKSVLDIANSIAEAFIGKSIAHQKVNVSTESPSVKG
jgi:hypothetical protein